MARVSLGESQLYWRDVSLDTGTTVVAMVSMSSIVKELVKHSYSMLRFKFRI
jgi:hypothetical protein